MRLPKEQYLALKKYKREVNSERAGKLVRDHRGHLFRVNDDGSLQRCGRDDLREAIEEHAPGIVIK